MALSTSIKPKDSPSPLDVTGDFRNLRTHGGATLEELKEFLGKLRGKSPQEVISIVSPALIQACDATGITMVLLAVFTVGPYLIWGPPKAKSAPVTQSPQAAAPVAAAAKSETKSDDTPSSEDAAKAVKAMGMDETKTADPKANPLEKDLTSCWMEPVVSRHG
jgi:hypothetical protein